MQVSQIFEEIS